MTAVKEGLTEERGEAGAAAPIDELPPEVRASPTRASPILGLREITRHSPPSTIAQPSLTPPVLPSLRSCTTSCLSSPDLPGRPTPSSACARDGAKPSSRTMRTWAPSISLSTRRSRSRAWRRSEARWPTGERGRTPIATPARSMASPRRRRRRRAASSRAAAAARRFRRCCAEPRMSAPTPRRSRRSPRCSRRAGTSPARTGPGGRLHRSDRVSRSSSSGRSFTGGRGTRASTARRRCFG